MKSHPSGKAFRYLLKKFRRGAAENQKAGRQFLAVGKHPQERKKIQTKLYFIQYNQAGQWPQHKRGIAEAGLIVRILQVKAVHRALPGGCKLPGQRGFACLPGSENSYHGKSG